MLPGGDPDIARLEMFSAPVQEEKGGRALVHTTGSYLLSTDRLLEDAAEELCRLYSSLQSRAQLIPQLESEIQTWAKAQNHLRRMLHRYCHVAQEAR